MSQTATSSEMAKQVVLRRTSCQQGSAKTLRQEITSKIPVLAWLSKPALGSTAEAASAASRGTAWTFKVENAHAMLTISRGLKGVHCLSDVEAIEENRGWCNT